MECVRTYPVPDSNFDRGLSGGEGFFKILRPWPSETEINAEFSVATSSDECM